MVNRLHFDYTCEIAAKKCIRYVGKSQLVKKLVMSWVTEQVSKATTKPL